MVVRSWSEEWLLLDEMGFLVTLQYILCVGHGLFQWKMQMLIVQFNHHLVSIVPFIHLQIRDSCDQVCVFAFTGNLPLPVWAQCWYSSYSYCHVGQSYLYDFIHPKARGEPHEGYVAGMYACLLIQKRMLMSLLFASAVPRSRDWKYCEIWRALADCFNKGWNNCSSKHLLCI